MTAYGRCLPVGDRLNATGSGRTAAPVTRSRIPGQLTERSGRLPRPYAYPAVPEFQGWA
jgi:hypothetical protein